MLSSPLNQTPSFNLIISNPPYITRAEYQSLAKSVKDWEDPLALIGQAPDTTNLQDDGLDFYRKIISLLPELLQTPNTQTASAIEGITIVSLPPSVVFEIGHEQALAVSTLLQQAGYKTEVWKDQFERDRVVLGYTT